MRFAGAGPAVQDPTERRVVLGRSSDTVQVGGCLAQFCLHTRGNAAAELSLFFIASGCGLQRVQPALNRLWRSIVLCTLNARVASFNAGGVVRIGLAALARCLQRCGGVQVTVRGGACRACVCRRPGRFPKRVDTGQAFRNATCGGIVFGLGDFSLIGWQQGPQGHVEVIFGVQFQRFVYGIVIAVAVFFPRRTDAVHGKEVAYIALGLHTR